MNAMKRVSDFFTEVKRELGKVTWMGKDEFFGQLYAVCMIVAIAASLLFMMDSLFGFVLRKVLS